MGIMKNEASKSATVRSILHSIEPSRISCRFVISFKVVFQSSDDPHRIEAEMNP